MRRGLATTVRRSALAALAATAAAGGILVLHPPRTHGADAGTGAARTGAARADAGAPGGEAAAERRDAVFTFFHLCWAARANNPELLDRCYAPEGRFRAVRVGPKGETTISRAQWLAEKGAVARSIRNGGTPEILEHELAWSLLTIEPVVAPRTGRRGVSRLLRERPAARRPR